MGSRGIPSDVMGLPQDSMWGYHEHSRRIPWDPAISREAPTGFHGAPMRIIIGCPGVRREPSVGHAVEFKGM